MNRSAKYQYYSKGYVVIKNVLNRRDLNECKKQTILSYNKILDKNINYKNIHKLLTEYENKKEWDKMYDAFNNVRNSKAFLKISKKLETLTKNFFNIKAKKLTCGYAIGIKNSKRTSYNWHQEKTYYSKKNFSLSIPFFW